MKVLSLFSGIGGFDLGFQRAGMEVIGMCEIDKHAQRVLQRHFPEATLHTDVKEVHYERGSVDLICGGFPCQDLSVAGKRRGLDGERSGLWFEFARIIDTAEPAWVVIENVPGLFSSARGEDFAVIIQWLANRGYGVGWRVLDAQGFGLAQRRKRVFIVASFGSPRGCTVLLEPESLRRNHTESKRKGKADSTAAAERSDVHSWSWKIRAGGNPSGERGGHQVRSGGLGYLDKAESAFTISAMQDQFVAYQVARPLLAHGQRGDWESENIIPYAIQGNIIDRDKGGANGIGISQENVSYTLTAMDRHAVGVLWEMCHTDNPTRICPDQETSPTLVSRMGTGGNNIPLIGVRRLTPTECERLQGFPDGWTDGQPDTHRYKQLGNAVAVPVATWIGKRIMGEMQ
jgi:DNA (cytosine-5)-methyltransferase 1